MRRFYNSHHLEWEWDATAAGTLFQTVPRTSLVWFENYPPKPRQDPVTMQDRESHFPLLAKAVLCTFSKLPIPLGMFILSSCSRLHKLACETLETFLLRRKFLCAHGAMEMDFGNEKWFMGRRSTVNSMKHGGWNVSPLHLEGQSDEQKGLRCSLTLGSGWLCLMHTGDKELY